MPLGMSQLQPHVMQSGHSAPHVVNACLSTFVVHLGIPAKESGITAMCIGTTWAKHDKVLRLLQDRHMNGSGVGSEARTLT